jgi:hypothetical protein
VKRPLVIFIVLVAFASCNKKKLEGDSQILVGKWNWTHSFVNDDMCDPPGNYVEINPNSEATNYSLEILKKGKVIFYMNEEEIDSYKFNCSLSENTNPTIDFPYHFGIYFGDGKALSGFVKEDTLFDNMYFPFEDTQCTDYYGYFVKE